MYTEDLHAFWSTACHQSISSVQKAAPSLTLEAVSLPGAGATSMYALSLGIAAITFVKYSCICNFDALKTKPMLLRSSVVCMLLYVPLLPPAH